PVGDRDPGTVETRLRKRERRRREFYSAGLPSLPRTVKADFGVSDGILPIWACSRPFGPIHGGVMLKKGNDSIFQNVRQMTRTRRHSRNSHIYVNQETIALRCSTYRDDCNTNIRLHLSSKIGRASRDPSVPGPSPRKTTGNKLRGSV